MDSSIFDKIMRKERNPISLDIYDLERASIIGRREYKARTFKECLALYLIDKYRSEGYEVLAPAYKNECFTLLSRKNGENIIMHLLLDSEDERAMWRMTELDSKYKLFLVRDKKEKELGNIEGLSLEDII